MNTPLDNQQEEAFARSISGVLTPPDREENAAALVMDVEQGLGTGDGNRLLASEAGETVFVLLVCTQRSSFLA